MNKEIEKYLAELKKNEKARSEKLETLEDEIRKTLNDQFEEFLQNEKRRDQLVEQKMEILEKKFEAAEAKRKKKFNKKMQELEEEKMRNRKSDNLLFPQFLNFFFAKIN